jgi:hypothetical protein
MPKAPERWCDDIFDAYLAYTKYTEPPYLYRAWSCISLMCCALQRRVSFSLGDVIAFPNFYIVLVGPPAARKGTAMATMRRFADNANIEFAPSEATRQALINMMKEGKSDVDYIEQKHLTHSSLNICAAELTVFLGYNNAQLMSYLCEWFDCLDVFTYETLERGRETINQVYVNLLACTTPALLQSALPNQTIGSGLASRIIFVYAADKGRVIFISGDPNGATAEELATWHKSREQLRISIAHDITQMMAMTGQFRAGPGYVERYQQFRLENEEYDIGDPRFASYIERRPLHAMKLGMIFSASRGTDQIVTVGDFERGLQLLEATEKQMKNVYAGVGANPVAGVQHQLLQLIQGAKQIPSHKLYEMVKDEVQHHQFLGIIAAFEDLRYIKQDQNGIIHYRPLNQRKGINERRTSSGETSTGGKDNGGGSGGGWSSRPVD